MTRTGAEHPSVQASSTAQYRKSKGFLFCFYTILISLNLLSLIWSLDNPPRARYFSSFSFDLSYFFTIFAYYIYYYGKD